MCRPTCSFLPFEESRVAKFYEFNEKPKFVLGPDESVGLELNFQEIFLLCPAVQVEVAPKTPSVNSKMLNSMN